MKIRILYRFDNTRRMRESITNIRWNIYYFNFLHFYVTLKNYTDWVIKLRDVLINYARKMKDYWKVKRSIKLENI